MAIGLTVAFLAMIGEASNAFYGGRTLSIKRMEVFSGGSQLGTDAVKELMTAASLVDARVLVGPAGWPMAIVAARR